MGVTLIVIGLVVFVPAASAKPKPKPDLVVTHAKVFGANYAFAGTTANIDVKDTVENEGPGTAGPSVNELTLSHGEEHLEDLTRKVPKLKKDERSSGRETAQITIPADAKLGEYTAILCADARGDVKEKNELDNCEEAGKFYIAKKEWAGSFSGAFDDGSGPAESWGVTDARFSFGTYQSPGDFIYNVHGTVVYEIASTGGSCVYSGSGVDGSPLGFVRLNYAAAQYTGLVRSNQDFSYPVFVDCGDGPVLDQTGPLTAGVLEISAASGGRALPFGTDALSGSQVGVQEPKANFTWSLK